MPELAIRPPSSNGSPLTSGLQRHAVIMTFLALATLGVLNASAQPPGEYFKAVQIAAAQLKWASDPRIPNDGKVDSGEPSLSVPYESLVDHEAPRFSYAYSGRVDTEEKRFAYRCGHLQGCLAAMKLLDFGPSGYNRRLVAASRHELDRLMGLDQGNSAESHGGGSGIRLFPTRRSGIPLSDQELACDWGYLDGVMHIQDLVGLTNRKLSKARLPAVLAGQDPGDPDIVECHALLILQRMAAQVDPSKIPDEEYFAEIADRADPTGKGRIEAALKAEEIILEGMRAYRREHPGGEDDEEDAEPDDENGPILEE